jgi:hypothetical protein
LLPRRYWLQTLMPVVRRQHDQWIFAQLIPLLRAHAGAAAVRKRPKDAVRGQTEERSTHAPELRVPHGRRMSSSSLSERSTGPRVIRRRSARQFRRVRRADYARIGSEINRGRRGSFTLASLICL